MKLSTNKMFTKDGSTIINAYRGTFQKTEIEKHDLQDKEFDVEYYDDKIVLKVK